MICLTTKPFKFTIKLRAQKGKEKWKTDKSLKKDL